MVGSHGVYQKDIENSLSERQDLDLLNSNQVEKWFKDNTPDVILLQLKLEA